jgi:hypothetical protein
LISNGSKNHNACTKWHARKTGIVLVDLAKPNAAGVREGSALALLPHLNDGFPILLPLKIPFMCLA